MCAVPDDVESGELNDDGFNRFGVDTAARAAAQDVGTVIVGSIGRRACGRVGQLGDSARLGDGHGVGRVDLDRVRPRTLGHEALGLGRDGEVLQGDHRPRGNGFPGGPHGLSLEGVSDDGPLG